jgi:hypothetical protein
MLGVNEERIYRNFSLKDTPCIIMHYFLIAVFMAVSVDTDSMRADTIPVDGGPAAASDSHAIYTLYLFTSVALYRAAFPKLWSADHRWSSGSALVVLLD